jgi:Insertion element 4 transposase N-terminal
LAEPSLTQRLALAALVDAVPVSTVDEVLSACGRAAERVRTLPPWVTTYHVLASALCPSSGYEDVTRLLWSTLPRATGRALARQQPTAGAITRARARLGTEPLELVLQRLLDRSRDTQEDAVHLLRFDSYRGRSLWWASSSDTGAIRAVDLRGDDPAAAVDLVRRAGATRVTLCPTGPTACWQRVVEGLRGVAETRVGRLPGQLEVPWTGLRVRTDLAWGQAVLARAGVAVALEVALSKSVYHSVPAPGC